MQAQVSIDPYGYKLIATDDRKTFLRLTGERTDGIVGCATVHKSKPGTYVLGVFDSNVATLIHELVHICLFVLENVGINPVKCKGEPMAYLMDNLFTKVSEVLWVKRARLRVVKGPAA